MRDIVIQQPDGSLRPATPAPVCWARSPPTLVSPWVYRRDYSKKSSHPPSSSSAATWLRPRALADPELRQESRRITRARRLPAVPGRGDGAATHGGDRRRDRRAQRREPRRLRLVAARRGGRRHARLPHVRIQLRNPASRRPAGRPPEEIRYRKLDYRARSRGRDPALRCHRIAAELQEARGALDPIEAVDAGTRAPRSRSSGPPSIAGEIFRISERSILEELATARGCPARRPPRGGRPRSPRTWGGT